MAPFPHNYLEHVKQSDRKTTAVIRGTPIYDTPYMYIKVPISIGAYRAPMYMAPY